MSIAESLHDMLENDSLINVPEFLSELHGLIISCKLSHFLGQVKKRISSSDIRVNQC